MEPDVSAGANAAAPTPRSPLGLIVAALIVALVLTFLPAYRIFFGVSLGIGAMVSGGLYLWHKYRPLKEEDVHPKRPLGLD
ncbi:MAG: hypothetical protein NVS1B11_04540 [Terriglobales bacterium]